MILAGVSLSFVFNGGILDKSQQAVNEYENAANNESEIIEYINSTLEQKINEINSGSGGETTDLDDGLAKENTTIVAADDSNVQIVIPKGFAPAILETGRTDSMPGENGAVKSIMPKEQWNSITAEQINKGIVVVDNAITYTESVPDFNEYVWIPMPDSSKFARVAWNGPYMASNPQDGKHALAKSPTENEYWEDETTQEYKDMIDSVNINKGFYISRYEASEKDETTVQSKRGQKPWTRITQTTAVTVSNNAKSEINSHLIYGIEWDSVLTWLLDSRATIGAETGGTKTITEDDIQKNSSSWGNYGDSVGGAETNSGEYVEPGGTNEYWKANNIYDLAGNAHEWTQEKYSTGTEWALRGGIYYYDVGYYPAASRNYSEQDDYIFSSGRNPYRSFCLIIR